MGHIDENDPMVENWLQRGQELGWSVEQTASHLEASGSRDLADHLRAQAGVARSAAAEVDDQAGDEPAPAKRAPRGRRSAARADETA